MLSLLGHSHFSTFAFDHENGKYARSFSAFDRGTSSPSSVFSVLYCVFLFLVINRSVAGVVCPVAGAHYPVAGVILTVVEENHPVTVHVVACPVARVMQNCVAQGPSPQ